MDEQFPWRTAALTVFGFQVLRTNSLVVSLIMEKFPDICQKFFSRGSLRYFCDYVRHDLCSPLGSLAGQLRGQCTVPSDILPLGVVKNTSLTNILVLNPGANLHFPGP